jgi:hypothetical protein
MQRRHEWPWDFPADAYMTYHSVRLPMLGAGGFRLRCMLCKSWERPNVAPADGRPHSGVVVGVSAALPDGGGGRLLNAWRVMEWPDLDFELTVEACGLWLW